MAEPAKELPKTIWGERINQGFGKLVSTIPEEERPDIQPLVEFVKKRMDPGSEFVSTYKGRAQIAVQNFQQLEWARENWSPRPGDVLLPIYQKTGTTWMMNIVRELLYFNEPKMKKISHALDNPAIRYLEFGTREKYEIMDKLAWKPRMLVTHMAPDLLNMDTYQKAGVKIIQCYRNPKDTLVSQFHYMLKVTEGRREQYPQYFPEDFNVYIDRILSGKALTNGMNGEWYPHFLLRWNDYKKLNEDKFFRVSYEELKKDSFFHIKNIAKFLELDLSDDDIQQVNERTSFNNLKNDSVRKQVGLFRKGEIGDFKNYLSHEQEDRIEKAFEEVLKDTGITFIYE